MWPDELENHKTPLMLNIILWLIVLVGSCLIALPLAIVLNGI